MLWQGVLILHVGQTISQLCFTCHDKKKKKKKKLHHHHHHHHNNNNKNKKEEEEERLWEKTKENRLDISQPRCNTDKQDVVKETVLKEWDDSFPSFTTVFVFFFFFFFSFNLWVNLFIFFFFFLGGGGGGWKDTFHSTPTVISFDWTKNCYSLNQRLARVGKWKLWRWLNLFIETETGIWRLLSFGVAFKKTSSFILFSPIFFFSFGLYSF